MADKQAPLRQVSGGESTAIAPYTVRSAITGKQYDLTPGKSDWFGPGVPQPTAAPPEVKGRQFQMSVGVNLFNSTKTDGLSFANLRVIADSCDIIRLLIEKRKDQVCSMDWTIQPVKAVDAPKQPARGAAPKIDARVADLTALLRYPDRQNRWEDWLRVVLEDMLVIDAPAVYIQRTNGGDLYALRYVDGGTIKRLLDKEHGWTPAPPEDAYQQILMGIVAGSFTTDELIYKPRNPRSNKAYGYGYVEQIIVTAQTWLLRQASNLEYYDSGNVPEGFLEAGKDWTPEQIADFQDSFDDMLAGSLANRRKARVVPQGSKYTAVKAAAMMDPYDEWLARIACFCFGEAPTPFIKQMNRATGDNAKEAQDEAGTEPVKRWVKGFMDYVIQIVLKMPDLEFSFQDKDAQDPLERAQIDQIYLETDVLRVNEVREDLGLLPYTDAELADIKASKQPPPKPGAMPGDDPTDQKPPTDPAAKKKVAKATHDEPADESDIPDPFEAAKERKFAEELAAALDLARDETVEQVTKAIADGEPSADLIVDRLQLTALAEVEPEIQDTLSAVVAASETTANDALNIDVEVNLVNDYAVTFAKHRAAKLITTDATGGEMLATTRDLIRKDVTTALAEGYSGPQLAKVLAENYAFSPKRAKTIAVTEIRAASIAGKLHSWIKSGVVVRKRWLLAQKPCTICQANADQGEIGLLFEFKSGDMGPPGHPNCRCDLAAYTE